jgi:hypothetical protein
MNSTRNLLNQSYTLNIKDRLYKIPSYLIEKGPMIPSRTYLGSQTSRLFIKS